jgi:hypothetical protein
MPDNVWFIPESELADYEQQPEAIYDKALRLEKGDYCDQNVDEALTWYRKAEALGFYKAKYALGRLYHFGIGVQKDENKAIEYLTDFIEGCKSYDELKFLKIMLTDDILYKKRPTMGATYYLRTDLADKNLAAMYAADILTYKIKVKEFKEWEPYERSYIKGYPKARERVAQLYKEKDVWVSSFVRREQNDNKRMDELYKKMQDVVAAKEFVLASDSGVTDIKNYIRRYAKCVWPARMDAKIDKMNQFYHVIAWARIDINKKWYGTGFLAALAGADDYNNDIEEISYLIKICKEEKDSAYKKLRAEVETHRNGAEPSDDLTMMCLYIAQ